MRGQGRRVTGVAPTSWPIMDAFATGILADAPFLPAGKGALILIAGGIIMLLGSVLWSLVAGRGRAEPEADAFARDAPDADAVRARTWRVVELGATREGSEWTETLFAADAGFGSPPAAGADAGSPPQPPVPILVVQDEGRRES